MPSCQTSTIDDFLKIKDFWTFLAFCRMHTNLPLVCRKCGDGFNTAQELHAHRQTEHYSHYRHQCSQCGTRFLNLNKLNNHIRQMHSGEYIKAVTNTVSVCCQVVLSQSVAVCARLFAGERPFPCSVCSKAFASKKALRNHKDNIHGKVRWLEMSELTPEHMVLCRLLRCSLVQRRLVVFLRQKGFIALCRT